METRNVRTGWRTLALLGVVLAGCTHEGGSGGAQDAPAMAADGAMEAKASAAGVGAAAPAAMLAYERSLTLDVAEERIAAAYRAIESACRAAADAQCVVLDGQLRTDPYREAHLKLRATPDGVRRMSEQAGTLGTVVAQSSSAEDLTGPIADQAKQIEMLTDYRTRLEGLRGQAGRDIDALIRVHQELAQVQQQIESLAGEKARLVRRVQTETLTISIESGQQRSSWRPVHAALRDFGEHLATGLGGVITAAAVVLPWLAVLAALAWAWRLWRRRRAGR